MDNMYTGKSSRNPNMPLIWGMVIGLGLIAFGVYLYLDLAAWENSNEEMRMNSLMWLLYDLGGKLAVTGFFVIIGLISAFSGFKRTKELRQMKKGAEEVQEGEIDLSRNLKPRTAEDDDLGV